MERHRPDLCPVDKGKGGGRSGAANTPAEPARVQRRGGGVGIAVCGAGKVWPLAENQGIGRSRAGLVCTLAVLHPENGGDAKPGKACRRVGCAVGNKIKNFDAHSYLHFPADHMRLPVAEQVHGWARGRTPTDHWRPMHRQLLSRQQVCRRQRRPRPSRVGAGTMFPPTRHARTAGSRLAL